MYKLNRKKLDSLGPRPDDRSFIIQAIPNSNLILVMINLKCHGIEPNYKMSTDPEIIEKFGCISSTVDLPRVRPEICVNLHTNVRITLF